MRRLPNLYGRQIPLWRSDKSIVADVNQLKKVFRPAFGFYGFEHDGVSIMSNRNCRGGQMKSLWQPHGLQIAFESDRHCFHVGNVSHLTPGCKPQPFDRNGLRPSAESCIRRRCGSVALPTITLRVLAELQTGITLEHGFEVRPVGFVHVVERQQIDGDDFRRMLGEQAFHGRL